LCIDKPDRSEIDLGLAKWQHRQYVSALKGSGVKAYAADALYLGDGKVLIPSGFPKASRKLKEARYKVIEVEMSEFRKGDGGVTCLCSPVYELF